MRIAGQPDFYPSESPDTHHRYTAPVSVHEVKFVLIENPKKIPPSNRLFKHSLKTLAQSRERQGLYLSRVIFSRTIATTFQQQDCFYIINSSVLNYHITFYPYLSLQIYLQTPYTKVKNKFVVRLYKCLNSAIMNELVVFVWACSAVGSASHSHCGGRRFESDQVHQTR